MRFHLPPRPGPVALLLSLFLISSVSAGTSLLHENFEGSFPPAGWTAVDSSVSPLDCAWKRSNEYTLTGLLPTTLGAAVDSNQCTLSGTPEGSVDTALLSPVLDLTGSVDTVLSYDIAYRHFFPTSLATLDISTNAGSSWTTLATYNSSPPISQFTPQQVILDLSAYDNEPSVQLRWRYRSGHGWWVFVDNVIVGAAGPGILDVDPAEVDFGGVHTGIGATIEVTFANIANPGHGDLDLSAVELSGSPAFTRIGGSCSAGNTTLTPGASCFVRLRFEPDAVTSFTGQLAVTTTDAQSQIVPLSGTGLPTSLIDVDPSSLSAVLDIGDTDERTFSIDNLGSAELNWQIPLVHGRADAGAGAGEGSTGGDLLRQGLLLVHNIGRNSIVALDPATGDLVDPDFVLTGHLGFGSKPKVLMHPDGERLLLTHQGNGVVHAFDTEGAHLGVFAPAGGADTSLMQNIRGMEFHPDTGNLLVTSSFGGIENSVLEFDLDGNFLGVFIGSNAGGMSSPWSLQFREDDLLLGAGNAVHRFERDGTYISQFNAAAMNFVQQVTLAANGNVLVGNSTGGVWEFDGTGALLANHSQFDSVAGVHELPNGHLLVAANTGVHQIDRQGNVVRDLITGASSMFSQVKALDCTVPSWLSIAPTSGSIAVGAGPTEISVLIDASGLAPGVHEDVICIDSNDPARPRVQVPVTVIVELPADYASVTGTVTSAGHCSADPTPLAGATISASSSGSTLATVTSNAGGEYEVFLPAGASPFTLTASAASHLDDVVTGVNLSAGKVASEHFELALDAPCITLSDDSYHFDLLLGADDNRTLTIGNLDGAASLVWSIGEGPGLATHSDPRAHFPAQIRQIEHRIDPEVSVGLDPQASGPQAAPDHSVWRSGFHVPAYTTTSGNEPPGYVTLDALVPNALTIINANQPRNFYAGTFIGNDFSQQYLLASAGGTSPLGTFGRIDTGTGVFTALGTLTGAPAVTGWNSMKWDHSTGTLYAVGNLDELYTIDPVRLEARFVGRINGSGVHPNGAVVVAIAIAPDGLMYALDLVDDVLLAVDKTTAEAAVIGPVGIDANFAQDMDFDQTTGVLYWAGYNSAISRLFTVDTTTGLATPIDDVRGRAELLAFTIARPGGGCSTPDEIAWLTVTANAGTTAAHGSDAVSVSVSTAGLSQGRHEAFLCVASNDPVNGLIWLPVSVEVTDSDAGLLQGTVTGSGHCSQASQPLDRAMVSIVGAGGASFEVETDIDGSFQVAINAGQSPVSVTVGAPGHVDATVTGVQIAPGATSTQNVDLPLAVPCATVGPASLTAQVGLGGATSRSLNIGNVDGHAPLQWSLASADREGETARGSFVLSQNNSSEILPDISAGCPIGGNHILRRFYLDEHPGVGNRIQSVDLGIQDVGASSVLSVRLYALPSSTPIGTIPMADLVLIGARAAEISPANNASILSVPVTGTISDIGAYDLVVEVVSSSPFFPGANSAGQSHSAFVIAPSCGLTEPTALDQMKGFEHVHLVLTVNASDGGACAPPEQIPWLSLDQSTGTTPIAGSSDVTVHFDATGLAAGDYEAMVCVASNDPVRPLIDVPVELSVGDAVGDEADLALSLFGIPATAQAGGNVRLFATVANFGPSDATAVTVELALPEPFTFVSGRLAEGSGNWTCSATDATVTCDLVSGALPVGAFAAILEVEVEVDAGAAQGPVQTVAEVDSSDNTDPNPANNVSTVTTLIVSGVVDTVFDSGFECAAGLPGCR